MTSDLIIRPALPEDVSAITRIYGFHVETGLASFEETAPDEAEMLRRFEALTEAGFPYFVACLSGDVCGYSYAGSYRPRPAYRYTVENSVYVDKIAAGRGVGGKLLDRLIAVCTERGFRQMISVIGDKDNHPSIKLHESRGFSHAGLLKAVGFKHGRWVDSVLMQLELGEGEETLPDL